MADRSYEARIAELQARQAQLAAREKQLKQKAAISERKENNKRWLETGKNCENVLDIKISGIFFERFGIYLQEHKVEILVFLKSEDLHGGDIAT